MGNNNDYKKRIMISPFQIIAGGFALVILLGALLLMLPVSTQSGQGASFMDALFTSTSCVCVTGLVVQDTATYWTTFGQAVIICLIQIGGLGVVTVAVAFEIFSGKRIGLKQRYILQNATSASNIGGIIRITKFILAFTFIVEGIGAILMMPTFIKQFGLKGIWYGVFHSISGFCNAGFDLMGVNQKFSSLTSFSSNITINVVIMLLIVIGGIGFFAWDDIFTNKWHFSKYKMQTKVVLIITGALILIPALYFFACEFTGMDTKERILASFFTSITPRTAGFNTVDFGILSNTGIMVMIALMLIGGSPGSTAGGMKTTTFAVLGANMFSVFGQQKKTKLFKRSIPNDAIRTASALFKLYIVGFLLGACIISKIEGIPLLTCMFETASAMATVGVTLGITTQIGMISRIILISLMYIGRVGCLTLIFATTKHRITRFRYPEEDITIG